MHATATHSLAYINVISVRICERILHEHQAVARMTPDTPTRTPTGLRSRNAASYEPHRRVDFSRPCDLVFVLAQISEDGHCDGKLCLFH